MTERWPQEDAELVAAARAGSKEAFGVLVVRHTTMLTAVCRRALGDVDLAHDAAQEAVLAAWLSLAQLRQPHRFGSWLTGIGLNICRRLLRERRLDVWSWDTLAGGRWIPEPLDLGPTPDELAEASDLASRVRAAVTGLPPGQRAAVLLFYLRGLTYTETSALLGVEVSAVKGRLYKARAALARELSNLWKEERMTMKSGVPAIDVRVVDVRRLPTPDGRPPQHIVLLEDTPNQRRFPIWIGASEAMAIAMLLQKVETARPLTYTFAAAILQAAAGRLREARITRLVEDVYYAVAVVETRRGSQEVDARPSDAIALALASGTPIKVDQAVLEILSSASSGQAPFPAALDSWVELQGAAALVAEMEAGLGPHASPPLR